MRVQEALDRSRPLPDGSRKAVAVDGQKWIATSRSRTGQIDYALGGWASYMESVDLARDHPVDGWEPLHPGPTTAP
jgi:hypothetical protein